MRTDRDLDARLAAAAGIRDDELPPLPGEFLAHLRADAAEPASVIAARQLVSDAHAARGVPRRRPRRPARRTLLRVGGAVVAIAAAWATAVAVTPADLPSTRDDVATPSQVTEAPVDPGAPADGLRLVAAEAVTFPLSVDPVPAGLTPTFSRWGGTAFYGDQPLVFSADYSSGTGDRFLLRLFPEDPRQWGDAGWSIDGEPAGTATVDGAEVDVRRRDGIVTLLWERPDGRWVQVLGEGAYAETSAAVAVAESVVDRPQPVGLQFGLAPAGWSVGGYEESRSLDLVDDSDPTQAPLRVSLFGGPGYTATIDDPFEGRVLAGPVEPVTIQGQPGRTARVDPGDGDGWLVTGQLPAGPLFLMVAPSVLTKEQVLEIAEQITYTP
ncbi:hypothetical protein [Blastococcus xanthinilyticus]|uniref:Uncharacterized protein n=1 Tax=Blastococcus xanthinilyticus TaxID=1564164 RepID=A0A5S5CW71_9ACTN|nr:hypothetical protein [Blastococcus xanthinilyticus]TYP87855.1 hypothetical protein BD833_10525 [Blastococcus xanthinilyticus]